MEVNVTRNDIRAITDYMENGGLVEHMNKAGLSFGAMALILTAISNECDKILDEMNKEEENVC
jgi:hypothetical protein